METPKLVENQIKTKETPVVDKKYIMALYSQRNQLAVDEGGGGASAVGHHWGEEGGKMATSQLALIRFWFASKMFVVRQEKRVTLPEIL